MTKKIKQPQSLFQSRPRTGEMVPQLGAQAAAVGFTSQHAHGGSQLSVCSPSFREPDDSSYFQTHGSHTYMQVTHTYKILSKQKSRHSACVYQLFSIHH